MFNNLVTTPILFLIFNRPDCTFKTFEAIRSAKPPLLFIAADGPRSHKDGEIEKCEMARKVADMVDWPCELQTLFRETNLGCKLAVSSAIDWFFSQVEAGIILEDDCVPNPSFFSFSEAMLEKYIADERVMMVCGTNYLYGKKGYVASEKSPSYFFSDYYPIWGWATWKRAWNLYKVDIPSWPDEKEKGSLYWLFSAKRVANHYKGMFDLLYYQGFDTWDIQWWYACIFNRGLAIIPKVNLISNIGSDGTHTSTQGHTFLQMPVSEIDFSKLEHPSHVFPDYEKSQEIFKIIGTLVSPYQLLKLKSKQLLSRFA